MADGALLLQDLESTNGTFVNGTRLSKPYRLEPGDVIRVGATELRLLAPEGGTMDAERVATTASHGGAAIGGSIHADRGSIGAIGTVGGDVDMSRHTHDASGMAAFAQTRGAARFFIVLGIFVSLVGFAFFGYPIVREIVAQRDTGSSPSELTAAIRECEEQHPDFSEAQFRCIQDAQNRQFEEDTQAFAPDLTPWLPLGAGLFLAGMVLTLVGLVLRRAD
jgi:pSer/pThr/pTyr-binding forkhead associated (FHA) protein